MKITHMIFSLGVGGTENIMVDIMNRQVTLGHSVELIIINNGIVNDVKVGMNDDLLNKIDNNIKIFKLNRPAGSKNLFYIIKLYVYLFLSTRDIIHCHNTNIGILIQFYKVNKLLTVHASVNSKKMAFPFKNYDSLTSITYAVKKSVEKFTGMTSNVIYNGIKTETLRICRKQNNNSFKVIVIGRLAHKLKGQDLLIKAFAQIIGTKVNNVNLSCDFIGDGASESYLKKLVKEFGLEEKIHFLGLKNREYVYEHLCEYDLLVQPSRYEGFGLTIVEAMAAKVPVLVSNIDAPMEVIKNGELGEYFESENYNDLADKLLSCIKNMNNTKVDIAYKYVKKNYDINRVVDEYIKLYKKINVGIQ